MTACDYPPPLSPGDAVAIVAPSHAAPEGALERGVSRLRSFGLEPVVYETATRDTEWLRANPDARAADVRRAFEDDAVDGVVAVHGGNRELQIAPDLDPALFRENPKRFYGSSDNTHLHLLLNEAGLVSFYGGQLFPDLVADPEMHEYTRRYVERAFRATPFGRVEPAAQWTDEYFDVADPSPRTWFDVDGWGWHNADGRTVTGPAVGGCFEMLETQLMLDERFFELLDSGSVLVVETSGETPEPAEVERFFGVLGERGALERVAAVLVGKPETPGETLAERNDYRDRQRWTVATVVDEYADVPVVFDLDFGHTAPVLPLPLGAEVTVDTDAQTVAFE